MTKQRAASKTNHRTRVGKQRREQTEARILRAAVNVFASKSFEDVSVNDFLEEAQVSRGTFYNHYRTNEELLAAVIAFLHDDLTQAVESALIDITDPLLRMTLGIRIFYRKAVSDPVWADLVCARMLASVGTASALRRDLAAGKEQGLLRFEDVENGVQMVVGTMLRNLHARSKDGWKAKNEREMVCMMLRGLGAADANIDAALAAPIPRLPRKPHTFPKKKR